MSQVALIVTYKAAPGRKDDLIAGVTRHARGTLEDDEGCVRFDVLEPRGGVGDVMLYELYRDQAALDAHTASERLKLWREESVPLVASREILTVDVRN